jgi:hypothetical protein
MDPETEAERRPRILAELERSLEPLPAANDAASLYPPAPLLDLSPPEPRPRSGLWPCWAPSWLSLRSPWRSQSPTDFPRGSPAPSGGEVLPALTATRRMIRADAAYDFSERYCACPIRVITFLPPCSS